MQRPAGADSADAGGSALMRRRGLRILLALLTLGGAACGGSSTGPTPVQEGPVVQSITPTAGPITGGTEVTIRGQRFAAGASVAIGGQAAVDVSVQGSDTIIAKTPAGQAGAVSVVVTVAGRSGSLPGAFTYMTPPSNNPPVISAIAAQGIRPAEPANFADLQERITVLASVRDDETPVDQLDYQWSASAGAFEGSGARVTWVAPDSAPMTPVDVTITLRVVEKYGAGGIFQHQVTGTHTVSLHDSVRELGEMSVRFLTEFSKPQTNKDSLDIMRDFKASVCPDPKEVEDERQDVIRHYTYFEMHAYEIRAPSVQVNFGGRCPRGGEGDACISVPVFWESTDSRDKKRGRTSGVDHLTGVYARADKRWWLCSSRYEQTGTLEHFFYSDR